MGNFWFKVFATILMFLAESVTIYNEILSAKNFEAQLSFTRTLSYALPMLLLGGIGLVLAYMWGIRAFQNIWIVSVISITSILIAEPILNYAIFKQLPTRGALLGLIFGAVGFLFALFLK